MNLDKLKGHIPDTVITQLPDTIAKFELNTPLRLAHFLAQAGHESGGFKALNENLNYGLIMILFAALTEALIYFLVRRIKTTNHWNHVFISYFLGAVLMSVHAIYNYGDTSSGLESADKGRVGLAVIINGIIGTVGYFLRFFASYRLEPEVYAPLSYFGVVMSYVYGIAFDNELLNWKKVLGTVSILASNYFAPKGV